MSTLSQVYFLGNAINDFVESSLNGPAPTASPPGDVITEIMMTQKAREVLDDCRLVLQMLEEETDLQKWRIFWIAGVALVRSVGYVLDKVDCRSGLKRQISKAAFKAWNGDSFEHAIFREFIDRERHNILKEYQFNFHPLSEVEVVVTVGPFPRWMGKKNKLLKFSPSATTSIGQSSRDFE